MESAYTWLIKDLEKVQMHATKLVISINNLTYKDRLKRLKLPSERTEACHVRKGYKGLVL